MSKLEMLSPYLAYGLRVRLTDAPSEISGVVIGVELIKNSEAFELVFRDDGGMNWMTTGSKVKPLFRRFSSLVEEVEHEGKKIVPAVEVARLTVTDVGSECKWSIAYSSDELIVVQGGGHDVLIEGNWNVEAVLIEERQAADNQYEIHQLLRRLHFAPPGLDEAEYIVIGEG